MNVNENNTTRKSNMSYHGGVYISDRVAETSLRRGLLNQAWKEMKD